MCAWIVILNWNGWADTIECLETVFRSDYPSFRVVVCDNDSQDGSLEHLKAWAEGRLEARVPGDNPLRALSFPPIRKPVPYVEYERAVAELGGDPAASDLPLVLVQTGANLGFAGGNNVGLRYVIARGDGEYVWLLNNDTVVRPDSLRQLILEMRRHSEVGIVGSTLLYYHAPDTIQTLGGASYNRWLALPHHIGALQSANLPIPTHEVTARMAYVSGASMLVSRDFLHDVGLLSEEYFLYFEELDWAVRAKGKFELGYAPQSVVYHKEGGTAGARSTEAEKSWVADYYFMRNRIVFTRKFLPAMLPTVYFALLVALLRRARRGRWDRVRMIAKLCWSP